MTDKTPEALELAARFERHARYHGQDEQAAALLRRQHARIEALERAVIRMLRCFPTDSDLQEAGWESQQVEEACSAHDAARALLTKKD